MRGVKRQKSRRLLQILGGLGVVLSCLGWIGGAKPSLGVEDGKLSPCPATPNCVSSQCGGCEPFLYREDGIQALSEILHQEPRAKVVTLSKNYLHAEFRSRWLKFVDDVEFYTDAQKNVIHVRSASRLGYSDLGVNHKRVEKLRDLYTKHISKLARE